MLVLNRRLNDVVYIGRNIRPDDLVGSCDWAIKATSVIDSFDRPRVYADVWDKEDWRLVQFSPQSPSLKLDEATVRVLSVKHVMWGSTEEPVIYFGFDAPKEIKIVRENALRKTRDDD